jgi:hypothetical protein
MPRFRTPTFVVVRPRGDFLEHGTRVDARPPGHTHGEARRVRLQARTAGTVA